MELVFENLGERILNYKLAELFFSHEAKGPVLRNARKGFFGTSKLRALPLENSVGSQH
jgi:hypothetical protein